MICHIAHEVKDAGKVNFVEAYKPRTSPYAFQGMGTEGILALAQARKQTRLPVVTELMSADKLDEFVEYVDVIQIGARNMQNFDLLKAVGKTNKPVLLKRGLANTIEDGSTSQIGYVFFLKEIRMSCCVSVVSAPLNLIHEIPSI